MDERRPDPEELLKQIKQEEIAKQRGKLKIFFGYAAGVGKTYAMLEAAHVAYHAGVDVVAGYVEPHQRPETSKLLDGLELLPPLKVTHNGIMLNEFDLDGALKRNPDLILVDELAHTNDEQCRHLKRYQDINELLDHGIDVYTTINVQHIESLNDIIASITAVVVKERIPDYIFDNADQVELVDIEPEDLIKRLEAGKIYQKNQVQRALGNFFMLDNLIALREIALRRTADRVNKKFEQIKPKNGEHHYTNEHILICLSPAPSNQKVIRTAARMANAFFGEFSAEFERLIAENYIKAKTVTDLAQMIGYGVNSFRMKFKKVFGIPAYEWLMQEKSKRLLVAIANSEDDFKNIIDEFDFSSHSHFYKFCKARFGYSPTELRKKLKSL